ncbi:MAG: hypothetical protein WEE20_06120 [Bacteroidota bacterium]
MKTLRAAAGPFLERPYFKSEEIERICIDELQAAKLYPDAPSPVRIDRFIERKFNVTPIYNDLPEDVLGYTEFGENGVQAIVVSRALSEEGTKTAEYRLNTTLGHEAGHGLLHSYLFALAAQSSPLFNDEDVNSTKILCRNQGEPSPSTRKRYDGKWWEYQANQCMAALLLPKPLVAKCMIPFLENQGLLGIAVLPGAQRDHAINHVAGVFQVNPVVARIRIGELYPKSEEKQLVL